MGRSASKPRWIRFAHHRSIKIRKEIKLMLYTIIGILLLLWILGFSMHVGGNVIHALLVIALVVFLVNLITGRRAV
jgi:hypothetical protein